MFLPVVLDKKAICFLAIMAIRPKLWQFRLVLRWMNVFFLLIILHGNVYYIIVYNAH